MDNFKNLYLLKKMFQVLNINISSINNITGLEINRDLLLSPYVREQYLTLIPKAKSIYRSSNLTSLHKNCSIKQKNHSINFLRQILKCNNLKLQPKTISLGYTKNGKKIIKRSYTIINTNSSNLDQDIEIKNCLNDIIQNISN